MYVLYTAELNQQPARFLFVKLFLLFSTVDFQRINFFFFNRNKVYRIDHRFYFYDILKTTMKHDSLVHYVVE